MSRALQVSVRAVALALAALAASLAATPARAAVPRPEIRAPAAILVEPATGDVVFSRLSEQRRPIASTTKLMTALVTLDRRRLGDVLTVRPYHSAPAESVAGLHAGERMTVADLLRALLLASANDAAYTLAQDIGGSERGFVRLMNRRARELDLSDTRYANPIGLDEAGNYSSAEDLVKLALILRRHAFFREVTNRPSATLRSGSHPRTVVNRNTLVQAVPLVNGVKTGHTRQAGYVLVGSATAGGVTVLSAVLGDPSEAARDADSLALLRYGLRRYYEVTALRAGEVLATARLAYRDARVGLVSTRTVRRIVRRGDRVRVRLLDVPRQLDGPLPAHARVGTAEIRWRGRTIARVPIVTATAVSAATVLDHGRDVIAKPLVIVLLAAAAVCSLQLVLLRRRAARRRRRAGETGIA